MKRLELDMQLIRLDKRIKYKGSTERWDGGQGEEMRGVMLIQYRKEKVGQK